MQNGFSADGRLERWLFAGPCSIVSTKNKNKSPSVTGFSGVSAPLLARTREWASERSDSTYWWVSLAYPMIAIVLRFMSTI
jgi:hypothetical protein